VKATLTVIAVAIAALIVITLLVRAVESQFAFFPQAGETTTPRQFGVQYEVLSIATDDGQQLSGWSLGVQDPRAHIVYFHGNGGNLSIWAPILAGVARQGYSVVAFDYRGYGNSTGHPTERGLYRDADAILKHFWRGPAKDKPVVYWGRSLGGAVAAYAATVRAPDRLILESAFPDVQAVIGRSLPLALLLPFSTYRFPAAAFLQKIAVPVLVMHGDRDGVIPFPLGRALFEGIPGVKQFVTIQGGDHNDVAPRDPGVYWTAVETFIEGR
jgi:fermentation-respiration switch protein FrsA (DUF1100 family)